MKIVIAVILLLLIVTLFNKKKSNISGFLEKPIIFIDENPNIDYSNSLDKTLESIIKKMLFSYQQYGQLNDINKELNELLEDTKKPLIVVIMGEFKAGKSTFINALIDMDCLKSDVTPATAAITMLSYGETPSIKAYFADDTEKEYPFEELAKLSAEGCEEMASIRQNLKYLEVRVPSEILKKITIIDTPGLNADNPLHTRVTTEFINRADSILWLFSYTKVGSRSEIGMIQSFGENMKPIGIINRIDEHDEEEEDLEDFLEDAKRRIGKYLSKLIGVSALLAKEGKETGNKEKLKDSRWDELEAIINEEIIGKSSDKKCKSTLIKLNEIMKRYESKINEAKVKYEEAYSAVNETSKFLQVLDQNCDTLEKLKDSWIVYGEYLFTIYKNVDIPDVIKDSDKLNSQKRLLMSVFEELKREENLLIEQRRELDNSIDNHNRQHDILMEDIKEYNHSGFFGGSPIFDFKGEKKELMSRQNNLNSRSNTLNYENNTLNENIRAFEMRIERNEEDGRRFCDLVVKSIEKTIDRIADKKKEIIKNKDLYKNKLDSLKWVDKLLSQTEFKEEITYALSYVSKGALLPNKSIAEPSNTAYLECAAEDTKNLYV